MHCHGCRQFVHDDARRCPHCGADQGPEGFARARGVSLDAARALSNVVGPLLLLGAGLLAATTMVGISTVLDATFAWTPLNIGMASLLSLALATFPATRVLRASLGSTTKKTLRVIAVVAWTSAAALLLLLGAHYLLLSGVLF